jgi:iron complex transport system substrate-binding protein
MTHPPLRVISLIPSATEIIHGLGLGEFVVGRSHECDYPPEVTGLPICTEPKFDPAGDSATIHQRVNDLLTSALSVYRVKTDVLEALQPTHIVTQAQCEVCAVSLGDVEAAVAQLTHSQPRVISLEPNCLEDVWADIQRVGMALLPGNRQGTIDTVLTALRGQVDSCAAQVSALAKPTVACIEWTEPLMAAGNWVPELVQLAGGISCFGTIGQHSPWLTWDELVAADPDVIVIMPCGYDLAVTRRESQTLTHHPAWSSLKAVRHRRVYLTDGNQYFNRPGPRLAESLEILVEIFHPHHCRYGHQGRGWQTLLGEPALS